MSRTSHLYLIALGSNMRTVQDGAPSRVIGSAVNALEYLELQFHAVSPIINTPPMGPSQRRFANAAAVIETFCDPSSLLGVLKDTEQLFGRTARGQRWRARVLDLDIVLWDGGIWDSECLLIPHPEFRRRDFVLGPANTIASDWRDPVSNLSIAQLYARLTKPRPVPR